MEPNAGTPELVAYMRRQIANHGPVTFKWFMQQALYHPEYGYYGGGRARIGRRGDFYTSVSVGKIFGELMAKQFEEIWLRMNSPVSFAIVEEGAHDGQFAQDVLGMDQAVFARAVRARQILDRRAEPALATGAAGHAERLAAQQGALEPEPGRPSRRVRSAGCIFPTNCSMRSRCIWSPRPAAPWQENFVDLDQQGFRFVYGPPSNSQLRAHLDKLPLPVAHGDSGFPTRTEVNLAALRWIEDWSKVLGQGYILLADYGYPRDVYYSPERTEGTLTAYQEHRRSFDPLRGRRAMRPDGARRFHHAGGARRSQRDAAAGLLRPASFPRGAGRGGAAGNRSDRWSELTPEVLHYIRSFKTLMHPSTMGMAFKFIGFEKNIPAQTKPLTGFSRCGDGRTALGLGSLHKVAQEHLDDPYAAF